MSSRKERLRDLWEHSMWYEAIQTEKDRQEYREHWIRELERLNEEIERVNKEISPDIIDSKKEEHKKGLIKEVKEAWGVLIREPEALQLYLNEEYDHGYIGSIREWLKAEESRLKKEKCRKVERLEKLNKEIERINRHIKTKGSDKHNNYEIRDRLVKKAYKIWSYLFYHPEALELYLDSKYKDRSIFNAKIAKI